MPSFSTRKIAAAFIWCQSLSTSSCGKRSNIFIPFTLESGLSTIFRNGWPAFHEQLAKRKNTPLSYSGISSLTMLLRMIFADSLGSPLNWAGISQFSTFQQRIERPVLTAISAARFWATFSGFSEPKGEYQSGFPVPSAYALSQALAMAMISDSEANMFLIASKMFFILHLCQLD